MANFQFTRTMLNWTLKQKNKKTFTRMALVLFFFYFNFVFYFFRCCCCLNLDLCICSSCASFKYWIEHVDKWRFSYTIFRICVKMHALYGHTEIVCGRFYLLFFFSCILFGYNNFVLFTKKKKVLINFWTQCHKPNINRYWKNEEKKKKYDETNWMRLMCIFVWRFFMC